MSPRRWQSRLRLPCAGFAVSSFPERLRTRSPLPARRSRDAGHGEPSSHSRLCPEGCKAAPGRAAVVPLPSSGTPSSVKTPGDPKPQGAREPDPRPRVRETANGPGRWEGTAGEGLRAAVYEFWPPGEPLAAGALFKGKKWIFQQPQSLYCCTKGCIDECERSAWRGQSWVCSAGSLRLPFARGGTNSPRLPSPCHSASGTRLRDC